MKKFFETILDLIYKKKCYFCKSSKHSVLMCPECYDELTFSDIRANRIINGVNVYCCGIYEKNLQKLIRGLKYHKKRELAHYLAKFMAEYFEKTGENRDFQVIPVPLHKNRIKKRKYNHMELVSEELCKFLNYVPNNKLISRIKDTKPQYRLSRQERLKNLSNAFCVDKTNDLGKPILIIDDICTTGSTFEEMINALTREGFKEIVCLAASCP